MIVAAYAMHHPWVGLVAGGVTCLLVGFVVGFAAALSLGGQDG